ncbi:hypothetical protein [Neoroseomonas soli]|uniref:Peptidase M41 domain-containing protein n=1 Tax=Neoroseomonas soli TaxID=1081025 RepID=A0A9X9WVH6_9PROT|nr:hypothetical protein [Neoroseomonas soli]MBR0671155.1 hypothetical protein [Neoroseomonas soli]
MSDAPKAARTICLNVTSGTIPLMASALHVAEDDDVAEQRCVAVHEAGHVVAALVLGISFRSVSIVPCADHAGIVRMGKPPECLGGADMPSRWVMARGIVSMAGPAAEKLFSERERWRTDRDRWGADERNAADFADRAACGHRDTMDAFVALWRAQSSALVEREGYAIDAVAHALAERGRMSAAEARQVWHAATSARIDAARRP